MYGERDEPYTVLSRLSQRLGGALIPDALLHTIVQTVAEALKLPYAAITVEHDGALSLEAAYGTPSPSPLVLPLRHHTQSVGQLILAHRAPDDTFSATDIRLLDDLARETGAAVHAMLLTLDLQRSRERLVTEREEERLRVSSDLHDGLGPTLASVMLKLGTIRRQLTPESDAYALLGEVRSDVQSAVDDIRRLARALRPPVLDELGLAQAIDHQAKAFTGGNLTVAVTTPEALPPLTAAVEVAAYHITLEALTNVVRHAHATECHIRLAIESVSEQQTLIVEVADDGRGLSVGPRDGIGIRSMHERAIEVGGCLVVEEGAPSGTLVRAQIPIQAKGTR
jgi:signal transduction histidine kinase